MTEMISMVLLAAFIVSIVVFLFATKTGKRLRLRLSGAAEEVISKDASTPEGAKAYYNAAIAKKEEDYWQLESVYAQILGKIQNYEEQLRGLQKDNMQCNINLNACVEKNDDGGAKVYLKRQQEIEEKIDIIKKALKELRENATLQKENVDNLFAELGDLKSEKENAVLALETAQATKSLQVTAGISNREEDKMLEKVRDGVRKTKEEADGHRVAYENSSDVQQQRLNKRMKEEEIERKLAEMKAKRKSENG